MLELVARFHQPPRATLPVTTSTKMGILLIAANPTWGLAPS
jgi:hypothetical protein